MDRVGGPPKNESLLRDNWNLTISTLQFSKQTSLEAPVGIQALWEIWPLKVHS